MPIEKISTLSDRVLSEIKKVLSFIKEKDFEEFVENVLIAKRVFITGSGRSGILARAFAMRLMQTGCAVYVAGETTVPPINKGDLLIAVSGSGNTDYTKLILEKAKRFGASTYLISARENSPMADVAERKIILPAPTKSSPGKVRSEQVAGSLFEQSAFIFLECAVSRIIRKANLSPEKIMSRHTNLE